MVEPSKRDWKLYREKIGEWQEHYMEKLVKEYADYLCSDLPASIKFDLSYRIIKEALFFDAIRVIMRYAIIC